MHYMFISLVVSVALSLASCSVIAKDKAQIEQIADDVIEEVVEDVAKLSA